VSNLNLSGKSFREELATYEGWLREVHREHGLLWERVAVYERPDLEHREWRPGTEEKDLAAYEERFSDVLASATRGWVNLAATTICDGTLIVAVEWVPDPEGRHRDRPVSVNRSGFARGEIERLTGIPIDRQ